jgi:hypothetical protein
MKSKLFILFVYIIVLISAISCNNKLVKSKNYKTAMKELAYHDYTDNYILIPKNELASKKFLIRYLDTIHLFNTSQQTFGFTNLNSKKKFIYQFRKSGFYKRIECDSSWNVNEVSESFGSIY